jgi:hypothetical protein
MSDFPQILPDGRPHRCELMACTRIERPNVPEFIRALGEYPFDENTFLSANHTVPIPPWVVDGGLPVGVLIPPYIVPDAAHFDLNGEVVFTVMITAITREELERAVECGTESVVDSLEDVLSTWLLDGRTSNQQHGAQVQE